MKKIVRWFAVLWIFPVVVTAQVPSAITMDEEPHHHLVLKNDIVKVFQVDVAPREALLTYWHEFDDISIVLESATTVSTIPGQADILRMSKPGEIYVVPGPGRHSLRNIGQTPYRAVLIDLLRAQTKARNLCGDQIPAARDVASRLISEPPPGCLTGSMADANAPRMDRPQFETDQTRVTLTSLRPGQQATFGESDRDELIVTIDETVIPTDSGPGKSAEQLLSPGSSIWIARGGRGQTLKNGSDRELHVVIVAFGP